MLARGLVCSQIQLCTSSCWAVTTAVKKIQKTRFLSQCNHLIIMKMLLILSTMEIYSTVWITMSNFLRILTLKTIAIYQVFSYKNWNLIVMIKMGWSCSMRRQLKYWDKCMNHLRNKKLVLMKYAIMLADVSRTGKAQFMNFISIIRMLIRAAQTGKLWISYLFIGTNVAVSGCCRP